MSASEKQAGVQPLRTVALLAPWVDDRGVACSLDGKPGREGQLYVTGSRVQLPVDMAKQIEAQRRAVWAPSPAVSREATEPEAGPTRINLNTASATELTAIKGVGKKTASDIVAHRKKRPFESLTDCAERVGGVSVEQLEAAGVII